MADQDSDSLYVTNQDSIVAHAQYCYLNYPTIVNNIPKEKNSYSNTPECFAGVDNRLAKAQTAIGESSNLAQLALTYTYSFDNPAHEDQVCILSVLAQCAIDNAKRSFACDIPSEIRRIKKEMDIDSGLYLKFWTIIKPDFNATRGGRRMINKSLSCPMNVLYNYKVMKHPSRLPTLPMSTFFRQYTMTENRKRCRRVEELIQKYSIELYKYNTNVDADEEDYLLLRDDFEQLIEDIRGVYISNNYLPLMSWLINRAFLITPTVQANDRAMRSTLNKNKSLLLKVLYDTSPKQLLQVFSKNAYYSGHPSETVA